jgi:hypothetical protein
MFLARGCYDRTKMDFRHEKKQNWKITLDYIKDKPEIKRYSR